MTIHRLKALFALTDGTERMIQGVREVFEITTPVDNASSGSTILAAQSENVGEGQGRGEEGGGEGEGMIVFIGRGLRERGESVERSLKLSLGL